MSQDGGWKGRSLLVNDCLGVGSSHCLAKQVGEHGVVFCVGDLVGVRLGFTRDYPWDLLGVYLLLTCVVNSVLESGDPASSVHGFYSL